MINLFGDVYLDTVYYDGRFSHMNLGGIANLNPVFRKFYLYGEEWSWASKNKEKINNIMVNCKDGEKQFKPDNGNYEYPLYLPKRLTWRMRRCQWNHICYIDTVKDISVEQIQRIKKIGTGLKPVSADVAKTLDNISDDVLKEIDVLFVESKHYNGTTKPKKVIVKNDSGSRVITKNNNTFYKHNIQYDKNLDTLGAGDVFAAVYIANELRSSMKLTHSQIHEKTTELLSKRVIPNNAAGKLSYTYRR